MAIKDILNKVSDGGYASLSQSEFNELKKYPEQKEIFNKISDGGYSSLSTSEFEGLKSLSSPKVSQTPIPTGYSYLPGDYEDLRRNVGEVGFSGLDERQKALFKSQFPQSKFAKAGGSFEDAVKYVDSQSNQGKMADLANNSPYPIMESALPGEYSIDPNLQELVKKHPGTTASLLAPVLFPEMLPLTAGGVMRAGLVGSAATAIDKAHPFTSEMPDYKTETPIESATDILGSGAGSALTHGLFAVANRAIGAKYYGALEKNAEAEAKAAKKNAEIAEENARRAAFNEHVEHQSMLDPRTKMHFYRNEMMRQNPEIAGTFKPESKTGNDLQDLFNEYEYARKGIFDEMQHNKEIAHWIRVNADRAKKGLPQLPRPTAKPLPPAMDKGIVEPSDWDVAKFKHKYETIIPDVAPEYVKVPNVDLTDGFPIIRKVEGKISNLFRGANAGNEAWFSFTNNPLIYPALKPVTSALARGIDPFAQYIIPEGIGLFRKKEKK